MCKYGLTLILLMGHIFPISSCAFDSSIRFDYTVYLHIDSTPPGVTLYTVEKNEGDKQKELGITPLTIAVGLDWKRRFWQRSWKTLQVTSSENCCEAIYNTDNTYDIFFACDAMKAGYFSQEYAQSIVTLKHPGYSWDGMKQWPQDVYINLDMDKKPTLSKTPPQKIPSMILASGKDMGVADLGELQVRSEPEGARIFVDAKYVGTTPLNINIPEGQYKLRIKHRGYKDFERELDINTPAKKTIHAVMEVRQK